MRARLSGPFVALLVVAVAIAGGVTAQEHDHDSNHDHDHDATASHSFDDVERWVDAFDNPERDKWQRPEEIVQFLELTDGNVVADLGAGTGYFMRHISEAVGSGRLYAVDIEPNLIEHLGQRAAREGLENVEVVLADPDDPNLPTAAVDVVLVVDTWHHINDRVSYLGKLDIALRDGGSVVVVDFREGKLPVGPPPGHKMSRDAVVAEFEEAGWRLDRESKTLPYQYVLAFAPGKDN